MDSTRRSTRWRTALFVLPILLILLAACSSIPRPEGWSGGVVSDDLLFIGTQQGELLALDPAPERQNPLTRWKFPLNGEEAERAIYGSPVVVDDTVYLGGYDRQLYALSLDGGLKWQEPVGGSIVGSPAVSGTTIVVGSADHNVYAFDSTDQSIRWRFETGDKVWTTPIIDGGIVYFGSLDHNIYAVDLEDGGLVWSFPTEGAVIAPVIVLGGKVIVGTFEGILYALDAATGEEIWRFADAESWFWASPSAKDGTIYVPNLDGNLYALDVNNGTLRWKLETDDRIVGAPVIIDELIAVPSDDGKIRVARLDNGVQIAACDVRTEVRTPLYAHEGIIYYGASDNSIRALSVSRVGVLDERWVYLTDEDNPLPGNRAPAC